MLYAYYTDRQNMEKQNGQRCSPSISFNYIKFSYIVALVTTIVHIF